MKGRGAMVQLAKKLKEEDWEADIDEDKSMWLIDQLEKACAAKGGKRTMVNTGNDIDQTIWKVVPAVGQLLLHSVLILLTFCSSNPCPSPPMPKFLSVL